ncbi:MAG: Nif3-like dinuclear metal center hexameric protein [Verrucomicrobia bacterium]|nr:Nif3-like dinuclear metal center hexameric protein [Verrucomicrobiota bacterium]
MAMLRTITSHLDKLLKIEAIPDYPQALNGLQLENSGEVTRVAAAVDACLPVIERAVADKVDLLLVHHGLFWLGAQRIQGSLYRKLKLAMDGGLAIYSAHIPLDVHPKVGNNALLAKAIGLTEPEPFFSWKGIQLGLRGHMSISRDRLVARVTKAVGASNPVHVCTGGGDKAGMVGIITGGAGSEIAAIADTGVDTFITGEGPHWSYTAAEELGVNLIYGGHYATETFGVRVLSSLLAKKYELPHQFIDHPTGL